MDEKTQKHVFWHFQPTRFTARLFMPGLSFAARDEFTGLLQVDLHATGLAYLHAAHMEQGLVTVRHWRELARQLRCELGATEIVGEHAGSGLFIPTVRAILKGP